MERTANYFTVGVFVSVAMLALVGFLIWLIGAQDFGRYVRYTVYFTDPVSGLADDAVVKYKGVDVGRILGMRLAPEGTDLVKIDIEVREGTPCSAKHDGRDPDARHIGLELHRARDGECR